MQFTKKDLCLIRVMLETCIVSINQKRHKKGNDMVALHELRSVKKKIDDFLREKENEEDET